MSSEKDTGGDDSSTRLGERRRGFMRLGFIFRELDMCNYISIIKQGTSIVPK